jgi:hypothetical protein
MRLAYFQEEEEEGVQRVLNLGDIIDGKCADVERWGGIVVEEEEGEGEEKKIGDDGVRVRTSVGHDAIDDVLEALGSYSADRILQCIPTGITSCTNCPDAILGRSSPYPSNWSRLRTSS